MYQWKCCHSMNLAHEVQQSKIKKKGWGENSNNAWEEHNSSQITAPENEKQFFEIRNGKQNLSACIVYGKVFLQ